MNLEKVSGFKIEKICLGCMPAQIKGIKVYDNNKNKNQKDDILNDEIIMDCDVSYHGDAIVQFTMHSMNAEIKNISFRGTARIVLKPLIDTFPFIFGVELTFLKMPLLDYNLGGIGTFGDIPVVSKIIRDIVENELKARVLWPNRIKIWHFDYSHTGMPLPLNSNLDMKKVQNFNRLMYLHNIIYLLISKF